MLPLGFIDAAARVYLRQLCQLKDLDQISRDRILDFLESKGEDISALDALGNDVLSGAAQQAKALKRKCLFSPAAGCSKIT